MLRSGFLTASLLLLLLTTSAAQAGIAFEAEIESDEVVLGSRFQVTFALINAEAERFRPPAFKGFKAVGGVSEMQGTTYVNGSISSRRMWVYTLEATQTGRFTIDAATATVRGRRMETKPLQVRVVESKHQSGRNEDLFLVGELNDSTPFVGQQIVYRIQLYTRLNVAGLELLDLPEADKAYAVELKKFDSRISHETVNGQQYVVKTLYEMAVFPQTPGTLTIDAAHIQVGVEQPGAMGALLGPKPVVLNTEPLAVPVKALPTPAPEGFTGGVGHFLWEVRADRNEASTDDAITLSIQLSDNGDGRRFSPPKIKIPDGLELVDPKIREEESYENEGEMMHRLSLDYVLLPQKPGSYEISPQLVVFDPDSNRYVTLSPPAPLRFTVTPGAARNQSDQGPNARPDARYFRRWLSPKQLVAGGLLLLVLVVSSGWWYNSRRKKRKQKMEESAAVPGRVRPVSYQVPATSDPLEFYSELYRLLQHYFGARLGIDQAFWSHASVETQLRKGGMKEADIAQITGLLERCEQVLYAGRQSATGMETDRQIAAEIFRML